MKRDSLFYQLFQDVPSSFFELIGESGDMADDYVFTSVEVKQVSFRADGVFVPKSLPRSIYFLETQFQPDSKFYIRFISEIFLYLKQFSPENDWRAVVIYPSRKLDKGVHLHLKEFFESGRIVRIYADELPTNKNVGIGVAVFQFITAPPKETLKQVKPLLERARAEISAPDLQERVIRLIETSILYKFPKMTWEEIMETYSLKDVEKSVAWQEATRKGMEHGMKQGMQQGMQQAKSEAVPELLKLGLTVEQIAAALKLSIDDVKKAAGR